MRTLLRLLHLLGGVGFAGALAAQLAIASVAADTPPRLLAARDIALSVSSNVVLPALGLMVLSGLLLLALRPALIEQRWLIGKLLIGIAVCGIALAQVHGAARQARTLAVQALTSPTDATAAALATVLRSERLGAWSALALAVAAVSLALWRPRLGRRAEPPTPPP
ncbi:MULTISPECIES: hypothetical protein [unclassified Methylibium]|uniref:hypothetical protein n=1 Tax=unclassified Methylibium TaxID=2633235 RepID=UPI0006FE5754|nr:hypothetical protein [Methylibium sp. Root1272]KQW68539.1 hypothetical protein ASC67_07615 [Methylibium sp. Root1272]